MTKKQKNKTIEDKDETIIEMAPIIKEKYTKLFLIISLTLSSLSIVLMIFFFIWFSSNDFEEKIYQETIKSSDNLNKVINNFKKEIKKEIENLRNDFVTNNQKFSNFNSKILTDKLNKVEKKINDLNSKVIDFEKNKVSNEPDPNVLSKDNNIKLLGYHSWIQNIPEFNESKYLRFKNNDFDYGFYIKLYKKRFLHLDLKSFINQKGNNGIKIFIDKEHRIFNEEFYLFDHPEFGILFSINKI